MVSKIDDGVPFVIGEEVPDAHPLELSRSIRYLQSFGHPDDGQDTKWARSSLRP